MGKDLGKTTGWIHRATLKMSGVAMMAGVAYRKIDDEGLHISVKKNREVLRVDHVVVCAGQNPLRELADALTGTDATVHLIGGADVAAELDAKRAIDQGMRLGIAM